MRALQFSSPEDNGMSLGDVRAAELQAETPMGADPMHTSPTVASPGSIGTASLTAVVAVERRALLPRSPAPSQAVDTSRLAFVRRLLHRILQLRPALITLQCAMMAVEAEATVSAGCSKTPPESYDAMLSVTKAILSSTSASASNLLLWHTLAQVCMRARWLGVEVFA